METPYVLRKSGMYFAHNSCGYTARVLLAEIYTEQHAKAYAKQNCELQAIPVHDCLTGLTEVEEYLERINAVRDYMEFHESNTGQSALKGG